MTTMMLKFSRVFNFIAISILTCGRTIEARIYYAIRLATCEASLQIKMNFKCYEGRKSTGNGEVKSDDIQSVRGWRQLIWFRNSIPFAVSNYLKYDLNFAKINNQQIEFTHFWKYSENTNLENWNYYLSLQTLLALIIQHRRYFTLLQNSLCVGIAV